jgi:hypothetical protein
MVFDVIFNRYVLGNRINLVHGSNYEETWIPNICRDFEFNDDGSISPAHAQHLALGVSMIHQLTTFDPDLADEKP